ncbi:2879_t:CDS:2 [Ambispora gerdemannii]|uniref:2879_t:CDS:1 n=1 Tax=Ambispora gerdemannii TaxID=144530 RepID=A0A9N8WH68_9GLOM|nr:2879_t:CDS:2 [Ambispora gerdemannii]
MAEPQDHTNLLQKILESVESLKQDQVALTTKVAKYQEKNEEELKKLQESLIPTTSVATITTPVVSNFNQNTVSTDIQKPTSPSDIPHKSHYADRVILTTYPGQFGIKPIPLSWAELDPNRRGPVLASRHPTSIKVRNAIGAYGGSYSVYRALAVAMNALDPNHRPDFRNTEPSVTLGPHPQWGDPSKIVSFDPFGHLTTSLFSKYLEEGLDIRPTIAITKAHMQLAEIEKAVGEGRLNVDGKIVLNNKGELNVLKAAVEPVWYLPGVAARFGIEEGLLRRALFEDTGGMYPELITRPDLKVFLPPIGGFTVYIFGNHEFISDPNKRLTVRVHDECNGSDVFGSDICTCRPYLIFGMEESVKEAQNGGAVRKEGRALGEVTKYLVYNARKRSSGGDTADNYFLRTENVAGVKDVRFQALMPDVLHWLGITKIDRMMSMSNMKYDAIVKSGIPIIERVPIPDELIPPDSRVEIDAKIADGYFSTGKKIPTKQELAQIRGREWDDLQH